MGVAHCLATHMYVISEQSCSKVRPPTVHDCTCSFKEAGSSSIVQEQGLTNEGRHHLLTGPGKRLYINRARL